VSTDKKHEPLPHSYEAEAGLLSVVLNTGTNNRLPEVMTEGVLAEWFYVGKHRVVWQAIERLVARDAGVDIITVQTELVAMDELDVVGGMSGLMELESLVEVDAYWRSYINTLQARYIQRRTIHYARALLDGAMEPANTIDSVRERIQKPLTELNALSLSERFESLKEVAVNLVEKETRRIAGEELEEDRSRLIYTGIETIDENFGVLNPDARDNLIVIAARPSVGKSASGTQVLFNNLERNKTCVMFCLETTREDVLKQMAAREAGIDLRKDFKYIAAQADGPRRIESYQRYLGWLRDICDERLFLFEDDMELDAILARIREVESRTGRIDLIVVDYLQLVEVSDGNMNREQQVARVSRQFKQISKRLKCVLLLLAQLNRDIDASGPKLNNLRESGAIEQDADRVWFHFRPEKDANGTKQDVRDTYQQKLIQAKMRNGPKCWTWLLFKAPFTRFSAAPKAGVRGRPPKGKAPGMDF